MTYQEKCKELGLKTLLERRDAQDMSLVHKFLTEKSGSDMFRGEWESRDETGGRRTWTECAICEN